MSWLFVPWSESVKKLSCRYVLQRYLGQFLEEKLSLDQLTVDIYNGIGSVSDVALDVQALNELGETQSLPFEFVDGFISEIKVGVPWSSILTESSSLEVNGLNLVIQPKQRADSGASMLESMWSSMTSSIQLAEECLKQSSEPLPENERLNALNGVEDFAKTIDSILARVRIKFVNTSIRLEHLPKGTNKGAAIEIHVKQFSYFDETSTEIFDENYTKHASAYTVKMFSIEGLELYTNEFYASNRTISRSLLIDSSLNDENSEVFNRRKVNHDIILFGKLIGKQELRLKIKQRESVSGPKVDFEINMSSLVTFLSPRQLRIICEVVCGLTSPHLQDTSNVVSKPRHNQKPMTTSDFERVEQELNQHINPSNLSPYVSKSLQNTTGWSSAGVEEESDDDFHPVKGQTCSSLTSSVANSVSSSYNSSYSSYHFNSKTSEHQSSQSRHKLKEKGGTSDPDFNGDFSSFQLRLNLLAVILLHQDVLLSIEDSLLPEDCSIEKMKSLSRQFFTHFMSLNTNCHGRSDFKHGRQILQSTSDRNHFRLYCTTLMMNGEEKSNQTSSEIHGSLTIANAELVECLKELKNKKTEVVELLQFNHADSMLAKDSSVFSQPDVNAYVKCFKNLKHFSAPNRTEITVKLQECRTEIDVTIIDRLTHVLNNLDSLRISLNKSLNSSRTVLSDVHAPVIDYKLEWKVTSSIIVKLRFPVPDLRTDVDNSNSFWCERNVYNDVLLAELTDASIQSLAHQLAQSFELQCRSVRLSFLEANCDKPVPFLFSDVDEKFNMSPAGERGFGWPRVVLRLYPKVGFIELEEEEESDLTHSSHMFQSIMQTQKEPSPFAAKLVRRESDTPHSTSTTSEDTDEIILPGSKEEIGEFIEDASRNALIQLNVTLPGILIQIPSKHFYEIIYNRFNNDLMLWMPRSSRQSFRVPKTNPNQNFNFNATNSMFTSFTLCRSGVMCNSDSDDEGQGENLMFHTETISESQKKKASKLQQSSVAVSLFVAEGVLDIFPHARNSLGKVIPEQFGEIQFLFREADLFCVSGYKAEPFLNYICLQINHISLYHCSLIPSGIDVSLRRIDSYPSKHVLPTLYKTQKGGIINENANSVGVGSINSDDMLTLAVRAQGQENRMKNICLANSLSGVTMRHRMKTAYTSWLSQLIDFFDVVDYPVLHYQPWKVVTQLHQQFLNCVIDYRPIHLPLKAALTVENFNISSNITAKTSTSILRLIAEEGSLFISNIVNGDSDTSEDLSIDLKSDYVCVVDMGLFELSLRLTDNGEGEPQTDLRASNNIVHIRTCADSTVALMDLVKYIASDGDLRDKNVKEDFIINKSSDSNENMLVDLNSQIGKEDDVNTFSNEGNLNVLDDSVPHLVEEAINDTTVTEPTRRRSACSKSEDQGKVEVFYFPNEVNMPANAMISQALSDSQSSDDEVEKDYFILEPHMLVGFMKGINDPEVRLLTKEPIRMVDNHFSVPISKVDVLKAPKDYPTPVSKYTLREMTIVWHMYGGHDFAKTSVTKTTNSKKHVTIVTDSRRSSQESLTSSVEDMHSSKKSPIDNVNITYLNATSPDSQSVHFVIPRASQSSRVSFSDFPSDSPTALYDRQKDNSWQVKGGRGRDQDSLMELKLTKLKYQFEIYPKNTKQASRQVLLVQEVEIRDRMATSQINKFLYQYSSTARPKQSNANMVVIKSTHIRPEPHISHLQECCLRVSLLPLRLNIDQDSLMFLINYFSEISGNTKSEENATIMKSTPEPVRNIENINITESSSQMEHSDDKKVSSFTHANNTPVFIRSFVFSPDVPIRLDYEGKRVDLTHGPLAGLIMGLGQLNCSELKLKRIHHRHGFLGLEKLIAYVLAEWLQDIKKNQLPSILGGVGPMYSVVQLFQGIRDLFWLPIEQYQKDGRIVRGLQRGANSFTTSSAMAVLEITARLVYAIQRIAETAFDIVSPGPSIKYLRNYDRNDKSKNDRRFRRHYKYSQPADIREGFATALQLVKEGFGETAQTIVRVASLEHEVKGAVGAFGGVLREIPSTAIKPIIITSRATANVLDGVRSQILPDARTEAALKWRTDYF